MTETKLERADQTVWNLDIRCLEFIWDLIFGIWNFNASHPSTAFETSTAGRKTDQIIPVNDLIAVFVSQPAFDFGSF